MVRHFWRRKVFDYRRATLICLAMSLSAFGSLTALAAETGRDLQPVALKWLDLSAFKSGSLGIMRKGMACIPSGPLHWKHDEADAFRLRQAITDELTNADGSDIKTLNDRFGGGASTTPEYLLGADLVQVEASICQPKWPLSSRTKGRVNIVVKWALFDQRQNAVVVSASTIGKAEQQKSMPDGVQVLLASALKDSLSAFFANETVMKALDASIPGQQVSPKYGVSMNKKQQPQLRKR